MSEGRIVKLVRDNISIGRRNIGRLWRRWSDDVDRAWEAGSKKEEAFSVEWKKKEEEEEETYYKYLNLFKTIE